MGIARVISKILFFNKVDKSPIKPELADVAKDSKTWNATRAKPR